LWPNAETPLSTPIAPDRDEDSRHEQFRRAFALLRGAARSKKQARNEALSTYLSSRGINIVPECAELLPASISGQLTRYNAQAAVFPTTDRSGRLRGAHVTFLARDARAKLDVDDPRRLYGPASGAYVLLSPIERNSAIIVAEGIETALSAMQVTGLPGIAALSASNLERIDLPPCREVIIAADNDENGTGQVAAQRAAARWASQGITVRIALPDRPEGKRSYDFNDALLDNTDKSKLAETIINAPKFEYIPRAVRPLTMGEFLDLDLPPRVYLLKPWLPQSGIAMIHAPRGGAKTYLSLAVGYSVATGLPLMDWTVERKGRVLYLDGELPGNMLQERLSKLGPKADDLMVLTPDLFRFQGATMPNIGEPSGRAFIDKIVETHGIELVVLDSLSTLVRSGEENDAGPWVPIQEWVLQHRGRGVTILLVHHESRQGKPRGTSKREDVLDTILRLKPRPPVKGADESTYDLSFTKTREFYGSDAADRIVSLSMRSGTIEWTSQPARESTRDRVLELFEQGHKRADIAKDLGVSRGRVTQILKDAPANAQSDKPV
jgi:putative DNA primase/helicase